MAMAARTATATTAITPRLAGLSGRGSGREPPPPANSSPGLQYSRPEPGPGGMAGELVDRGRYAGGDLARAPWPPVGQWRRRQRRAVRPGPVTGERRVEEHAEPLGVGERRVLSGRPGQGGVDAKTED